MLKGILLDIDGTLLLSNAAHAAAWRDALQQFGYDIPQERIEPLIGMGGDKLLSEIVPGLSTEEGIGKQVTERRKEIFLTKYIPTLRPAPRARDLIARLQNDGLQLVIATSAKSEELDSLLEAAGIQGLIEHKTTSDDAEESKPAPDIVAAALEKGGLPASGSLMIGDTPYDIESAHRAGVGLIAFRCGGHGNEELSDALAVYDDPADLLAHYDDSPIAQRQKASASASSR